MGKWPDFEYYVGIFGYLVFEKVTFLSQKFTNMATTGLSLTKFATHSAIKSLQYHSFTM